MSIVQLQKDLFGSYINFNKTEQKIPFYVHPSPHIEEVFILDILRWEGTKEFIDRFFPSGVVYIGCGSGELDDHLHRADGEKKVSTIELVAKALGIEKNPKWKTIVEFAHKNDTRGGQNQRDIGNILKLLHYQRPDMQEENISWALQGLWVKYYDQIKGVYNSDFTIDRIRKIAPNISGYKTSIDPDKWYKVATTALKLDRVFFQQAVEEIRANKQQGAMIVKEVFFRDKKIKIAAIESNNYKMSAALRAKAGGIKTDVVIIRGSTGRNYISTNPRNGVRLNEVAAIIRYEEQMKKLQSGQIKRLVTFGWKDLCQDGEVDGAEEWHFFSEANMLLNGSFTHPYVVGSALSLNEIFYLVSLGIEQSVYKYISCSQKGTCIGKECPWYGWGLYRCRNIRRKEVNKK